MPGTTFQGPGTRKMGVDGDTPYIVVAFLHWEVGPRSGGLNSVLVVFAAVVLLFTGRYPVSIFELVMGFNQWAYRVAAYASLMRDEYPPFQLST